MLCLFVSWKKPGFVFLIEYGLVALLLFSSRFLRGVVFHFLAFFFLLFFLRGLLPLPGVFSLSSSSSTSPRSKAPSRKGSLPDKGATVYNN